MTLDPSKLSPAPWKAHGDNVDALCDDPGAKTVDSSEAFRVAKTHSSSFAPRLEIAVANAAFIALARNAFEVMMRRGWIARRNAWGEG